MYIVEGNIGSGKSTLLTKLGQEFSVQTEPIDRWYDIKDNNNNSIFKYFYEDPKRYAFCFQIMTLQSRISDFISKTSSIFERSILSDYNVFAKTLFKNGNMTDIEFQVLSQHFDQMLNLLDLSKIEGIIYLKVNPEVCFQRIKSRNRPSEENVSLEYLQCLHDSHEEWLSNITQPRILIIDDNNEEAIEKIKDFIHNI
jgi:deoxyadenosine/deoxycytidine kinase